MKSMGAAFFAEFYVGAGAIADKPCDPGGALGFVKMQYSFSLNAKTLILGTTTNCWNQHERNFRKGMFFWSQLNAR
jgi:hypothetical protein